MTIPHGQRALLIDITRCIGCHACAAACQELHQFPGDGTDAELSATAYTVVLDKGEDRYVRKMCMHCVDPSCVSVCPVGAFSQDGARARDLRREQVPGLPLLHGGLPVRRAPLRVVEGGARGAQVRPLRGSRAGRTASGLRRGLPGRSHGGGDPRGAARRGAPAHPRGTRASITPTCTARRRSEAPRCCSCRRCLSSRSASGRTSGRGRFPPSPGRPSPRSRPWSRSEAPRSSASSGSPTGGKRSRPPSKRSSRPPSQAGKGGGRCGSVSAGSRVLEGRALPAPGRGDRHPRRPLRARPRRGHEPERHVPLGPLGRLRHPLRRGPRRRAASPSPPSSTSSTSSASSRSCGPPSSPPSSATCSWWWRCSSTWAGPGTSGIRS